MGSILITKYFSHTLTTFFGVTFLCNLLKDFIFILNMFRILHDIACSFGELMIPNYDNINGTGVFVLLTIPYYSHVCEITMIFQIMVPGPTYV